MRAARAAAALLILWLTPLSAGAHCHLQYQVTGPGGLFYTIDLGPSYRFLGVLPGGTTSQLGPVIAWTETEQLEIYHSNQIALTATDMTGSVTCPEVTLNLDGPPTCTDDGAGGPPVCTPSFTVTQTGPNAYACASSCVSYPQPHPALANFYPPNAPAPPVTSVSPHSALAGSPSEAVEIRGSGFVDASQAQWNATPLTTLLVDASTLLALVPAPLMASAGTNSVTVVNPGGASPGMGFAVLASSGASNGPSAAPTPDARAFPNPWTRAAAPAGVTFDTMAPGSKIELYTMSGRLVRTLEAPAGTALWDLRNSAGDAAASGYYFYLITGGGRTQKGRLALVR